MPVEIVPNALLGKRQRERKIERNVRLGKGGNGGMVWDGRMDGWEGGDTYVCDESKEGSKDNDRTDRQHKRKDIEARGSEALFLFYLVFCCFKFKNKREARRRIDTSVGPNPPSKRMGDMAGVVEY